MNDAELSVGIEDNLTPTLQKMAAQTRAFGTTIGAEAGNIDKAVRQVTKSIADLNGAGTRVGSAKSSPLAARTAQLTAELKAQEAILSRLSRAQGAYASSTSFSGFRDVNGKGISAQDVRAYQQATAEVTRLQGALSAIPEAERRIQQAEAQRATTASAANQAQLAGIRQLGQASADYAAKQAMYNEMFGKSRMWPPAAFKNVESFTQSIMDMQNSVRYAMYDVSRNTATAGAAVLALGVGAVVAAARWERAFADVERTVQATPATLEQIRQGLISLSQDIPVSFTNLAEIASIGGQMGISANGIVAYTETIAKLTATTNLTADAASKALGRFKAFFAEAADPSLAVTDQTFSNLASSILKVGVNSVATESGIVNVATQISSMGAYAGFTADQVIGLSGALSSVGVPPELSRGVITRLFNTIGEAVSQNGTQLQDFARLAGVSSDQFRAAWGTDQFAYIFTNMVHGLGEVATSGGDAVSALHDLGITSVRDVPVLLRLATAAGEVGTAGSLLAQTMNDARSGWRQNIELTLQYNKIADTLSERTKVLLQNFEALFATMGESAVGPVKELVNGLINLVKGFTTIASTPVGQTLGVITIAASVLAGTLLLMASGAARAFAGLQGLAAGLQAVGIEAAVATPFVRGLGIAMAGLGVIAAIGAVVGLFVSLAQGASEANNAVQDTSGALAAMRQDAQALDGFRMTEGLAGGKKAAEEMTSQADNLGEVLGFTQDQLYGVGNAATESASETERAALRYGTATAEFARSAVIQQKAFTDLFQGDSGKNFANELVKNNFDLDKGLKIATQKGEAAVREYVSKVTGVPTTDIGGVEGFATFSSKGYDAAQKAQALFDILNQTGAGFRATANQAYATGEAFSAFTSTTQMTSDAMADFEVQNQDVIDSMAKGFAQFVDTGSLIGLTQQMQTAFQTLDDGSTDIDEHAGAISKFEEAWTNAYGGAKFSIEDYMTVFRRAAGEQQVFIANLQQLAARGVPQNIIGDLAAMGPQAQALVQALINGTDDQLNEYVELYGSTGFDSMVALAAGQLAAQQIVMQAAKTLSNAQLQELSADLAAGTPLTDAMAKWNLDAQGKPMTAPATVRSTDDFMWRFQQTANAGIRVPVSPYVTGAAYINVVTGTAGSASPYRVPMANGGYTGRGGKWTPANDVQVHRGEVVTPAKDVDQATGRIKPQALLRMLNGATPARGGSGGAGYANGGYVTNSGPSIVHLSVEDRSLLMLIADRAGITITQDTITNLANNGNVNSSNRRQG